MKLVAALWGCIPAILTLLPGVERVEIVVEAIKALFPEFPVSFDPDGHLLQRLRFDLARTALCIAASRDQTRALKHFQVLRDVGQRHVKRLGDSFTVVSPSANRARIALRVGSASAERLRRDGRRSFRHSVIYLIGK